MSKVVIDLTALKARYFDEVCQLAENAKTASETNALVNSIRARGTVVAAIAAEGMESGE